MNKIKKMLIASLLTMTVACFMVACSGTSDENSVMPDGGTNSSENNNTSSDTPDNTVEENNSDLKEDIKDGMEDIKNDTENAVDRKSTRLNSSH